ncbi:lipase, partial [Gregarina niphandrodes]
MAMSIYPEESLKPYFGESIMVGRCLLLAHFPQLRMLMHNFEGGGLPWHALCDDPVQRRLVLIVRGSVDASDWFINLSVKLTDREAHGGYWHCCGLMLTSLRPLIDEFMTAHPDYELHVTGHSLGAGLAAMLAISLKLHYPDVKGWAYACPRCIGKELAEQSTNYITSVVYGRDCVPRLAVHTIHHIFDVLQETADMDDLELLGLENVTRIIPLSSNADDTPVPSDPGLHEAENDTPYKRTSLRAEY